MDVCQGGSLISPAIVAQDLLKWAVPASLLIGWADVAQRSVVANPLRTPWTVIALSTMLTTIATSTCAIRKAMYLFRENQALSGMCPTILRDSLANFAMCIGMIVMSLMASLRMMRGLSTSGYICFMMGIVFVATTADFLNLLQKLTVNQEIVVSDLDYDESVVLLTTLTMFFALGAFICSGMKDAVTYNKKTLKIHHSSDEETRSQFAVIVVVVIFKHLKNVLTTSKAIYKDFPMLSKRMQCSHLVDKLHILLRKRKNSSNRSGFLLVLLRVVWLDVFWVIVASAAYHACTIIRIPVLESLIAGTTSGDVATLSLLFVATCVGESLVSCIQLNLCFRLAIRVRAMLQAAMFQKMTRLSPTARANNPGGYIVSILGVDCIQLSISLTHFPLPIVGLLWTPVVFYLLASRVGVGPSVCCAAWMLLAIFLPFPMSRFQNALWRRVLKGRDERLKRMSDLLSSVRLVKMYAWEDAYMKTVNRLRDKEMVPVFLVNLLDGFIDSLYSSSSSVMIIILFGTLAVFEPTHVLSPAVAFSSIYMLSLTDMVTNSTSQILRVRSLVSLGMRRIVKFCTEEEHDERRDDLKDITRQKGEVILEKCSFAWTERKFANEAPAFKHISLDIPPGTLVGVTGFVGSGKSSLLSAILGDMYLLEGAITTSGRIGYVPQVACVYNMTVRDNILFGQKFDAVRYERVVRACELLNDLNKFPAGDLTEIGERGTTLSGGQKQRLALARAAYNNCNIYLLDDPLSALDANVSTRVFKQVLGPHGILANTTRILVSNDGHLLERMDQIVLMHGNRLTTHRNFQDLLHDPRAPKTLSLGIMQSSPQSSADKNNDAAMADHDESSGRVTLDEVTSSSKGVLELTWAFLKFSGICAPLAILFFLASGVALAWELLWIKDWTASQSAPISGDPKWVWGLAGLCCLDVLFRSIGGVLLAGSTRQLSKSLHHSMLRHVLFSPMSYFDSNPRGRIMNRFSADLDSVDPRMYLSGKICLQNVVLTVSKLAVTGTQAPFVLLVGGVAGIVFLVAMRIIIQAANASRYLESGFTSRVLANVTETMDSLSSVRSYGVVDWFCRNFCRLTDASVRGFQAYTCCYRLVRFLCSLFGFVVVMATLVFVLVPMDDGSVLYPSSVGLALTSSLSIPMAMMSLCLMIFGCLQSTVAFERCLEYTQLTMEDDVGLQDNVRRSKKRSLSRSILRHDTKWPTGGEVEFRGYAASYRPGRLPDVLKGISFIVKPQEKVGVVGRTGAGKSTLVLALLRVIKSSRGCILIDGVDIATVPLKRLRTAVTVIPQDPTLVRGSLRDNLDPTESHSDDELWRVLQEVRLSDFVGRNPCRLLMEAGDGGSNFSVGQRQLVCLARALLRKPRVLVLDEATSQMDGDTDRLIQEALRENFSECTVLAIAHRIHTVLDYDKILVMSDGRVVEYGPVGRLLSDQNSAFNALARNAGVVTKRENGSALVRTEL